ncbi:hypothetical protein G9U51_06560 [Calidifontibacter sp. DB0510]|uniref:YCII-related domain-containing protein n=1 Tax=Metallococcus carri TaxID=1656884 RepID=A0A967EA27_9MICO|nr:hypothetical protein [Metallococcus carri]NOP38372.1 hypothetical protein [Calidifontibacter sp. DB2511S]
MLIAFEPNAWNDASAEQRAAWHQDHVDFHRALGDRILSGEALADASTARTVRLQDGEPRVTAGPFAETTEMIGGYYLLEAVSQQQVLGWCEMLPSCYSLEVRPVVEVEV